MAASQNATTAVHAKISPPTPLIAAFAASLLVVGLDGGVNVHPINNFGRVMDQTRDLHVTSTAEEIVALLCFASMSPGREVIVTA